MMSISIRIFTGVSPRRRREGAVCHAKTQRRQGIGLRATKCKFYQVCKKSRRLGPAFCSVPNLCVLASLRELEGFHLWLGRGDRRAEDCPPYLGGCGAQCEPHGHRERPTSCVFASGRPCRCHRLGVNKLFSPERRLAQRRWMTGGAQPRMSLLTSAPTFESVGDEVTPLNGDRHRVDSGWWVGVAASLS
jgi:hypothetical protein